MLDALALNAVEEKKEKESFPVFRWLLVCSCTLKCFHCQMSSFIFLLNDLTAHNYTSIIGGGFWCIPSYLIYLCDPAKGFITYSILNHLYLCPFLLPHLFFTCVLRPFSFDHSLSSPYLPLVILLLSFWMSIFCFKTHQFDVHAECLFKP